ncbi:hypothetical protein [Aliivibrio fischeri]|uniref:Uncharacterized protein n=1 Tax=Aliivibrio fischeri TaxID=668 RepID=A0A844P7P1_ALIFS|nr:hypothetical protein [Aliivibrio fischeri]MUK51509.1 hypothetical protein [Aliivibrio fischeri]
MEVEVITSLIGIIGITLSAVFSGFGYFFKVRAEKLKTIRQILFYLLEFRAHVLASSLSPNELYEQYVEECKKYFDKKKIEGIVIPEQNQDLMLGYFANIIEHITPEMSLDFISGYASTINELAKEKPILAFKLRGKDVTTRMMTVQKGYLEQLQNTELFSADNEIGDFLRKQVTEVHLKALNEMLKLLDEELLIVSRFCGVMHYFEVQKILKSIKRPSIRLEDFGIEEMFDEMLNTYPNQTIPRYEHVEENG